MKTWKLCLVFIIVAMSCGKPKKNETPVVFINLMKRYPKLFPYQDFSGYHFVREILHGGDSLKMRLYDEENSGDRVVVFINKAGKNYAFPMPENRDSTYWIFYGNTAKLSADGKNFESEVQNAFKILSLDDGWMAESTFQDLTVSLLQTRIVMPGDIPPRTSAKFRRNCDTVAQKGLQIMRKDVQVVVGLTANTFYDYNHGRYYQFDSNMPYGRKGFTIKVFREPCRVEPMYANFVNFSKVDKSCVFTFAY